MRVAVEPVGIEALFARDAEQEAERTSDVKEAARASATAQHPQEAAEAGLLHRAHPRKLVGAGHDGRRVGYLLGNLLRWLGRRGLPVEALPDDVLEEVARRLHAGELFREGLPRLLRALIRRTQEQDSEPQEGPDVAAVCDKLRLVPLAEELDVVLRQALDEAPETRSADPDARLRHAMAAAMARCRGRVSGAQVCEAVRAILKGERHVG